NSTASTTSKETSHRFRCTTSRIPCAVSSRRSTCSGPPAWGLYGFPSLATAPMPRDRSRDDEDDEEEENFWKGLGKDLLVAAIIFRRAGNPTPVIHRAIMYITLHNNGTFATADVTALLDPRITDWEAKDANSTPTTSPYYLRSVTIHKMGFDRDLNFTFDFS